MASKPTAVLSPRDLQGLEALMRTPLTAAQLLAVSATFDQPFTHEQFVRRRMRRLAESGFVQSFQYATTTAGAVNYYKLTPAGYQLLNGPRCTLPPRRFFQSVSLGLQEHTQSLAAFIVQTMIAAHKSGIAMTGFYRENELTLSLGDECLRPDCAFQLVTGTGETYNYVVELDNGTEPVYSSKSRESLARKIRFYDAYRDRIAKRFRVLTIFTRSTPRLYRFLDTAKTLASRTDRKLFYAAFLDDYTQHRDPLRSSVFTDHDKQHRFLIPGKTVAVQRKQPANLLELAAPVW